MLKLFATKGTISVAVALVLEEVGAEYELCLIDFATEDQRSQAYLEINSKGRVPALVTEGGILTETRRSWNISPRICCQRTRLPAPSIGRYPIISPPPCI